MDIQGVLFFRFQYLQLLHAYLPFKVFELVPQAQNALKAALEEGPIFVTFYFQLHLVVSKQKGPVVDY